MSISPYSLNRRQLLGAGVSAAAAAGAAALVGTGTGTAAAQSQPVGGRYRIDLHAHFLPPEYRAALISHGYFTVGGYPTPQWSPEEAIDFMDRWGIQAQALSVSDPGVSFLEPREARDMARYCNTYAADLIAREGQRFGAFAVLPMPDIAASIEEAIHALDVLRLDGVILLTAYNGVYLGDPRYEPLMAALDSRAAYVFVHPGSLPSDAKPELPLPDFLYEYTFDTTRAATFMMTTGVRNRYPNIRFQLAHAGGTLPFLSKRIGVVTETPLGDAALPPVSLLGAPDLIGSYFYDTALSASEAAMRAVLAASDRAQIVFGSDWPFSALTLSGSGDPAPDLGSVFTAAERYEVEHINPLAQLPRLRDAVE
ncbi:amidohydrolase [Rhodococcus corynebacterioides]|nr:amidohydrolase [Rhodococcus corynebacterioides]